MPDFSPPPDERALAARLAEARRRMSALDLPGPLAARLHRQFIAVCDAVKAAGADEETGERRLSAFLVALERAGAKAARRGNAKNNSLLLFRHNSLSAARGGGHEQARPDRRGF
jgi:hypothetical protein